MIKILIFILILGSLSKAKEKIEIPFLSVSKKVVIAIESSPCLKKNKNMYSVEVGVPGESYTMICRIKNPRYLSQTPIHLLLGFSYPQTIMDRINASPYTDLKKQGEKAISSRTREWGIEYYWSTPTKGSATHTYLCPKKQGYCVEVIHGGFEKLSFDIANVVKVKK